MQGEPLVSLIRFFIQYSMVMEVIFETICEVGVTGGIEKGLVQFVCSVSPNRGQQKKTYNGT